VIETILLFIAVSLMTIFMQKYLQEKRKNQRLENEIKLIIRNQKMERDDSGQYSNI
jgi:hypothetical protein